VNTASQKGRPKSMKPIIVFLATAGFSMAHAALAQDCQQLWVERNSYYKELGYCFKTQTAIEYFGNGGCHIRNESEMPLTSSQRARINQIQNLERSRGCNVDSESMSCDQLWIERNSIYKQSGFCFETRRAIEYFGNGGCRYQNEADVPFSTADRARITEITRLERESHCG
jgi:hypothetical protein